jgi:sugar-specific transcriptional regulator TrmB
MLEIFEELGFSKWESKVYLALIELGPSTTGPIVKKSEVPQSKIYEILGKLMEKGLVSYVIKKGMKHFQAADPKALLDIEDRRRKKIEEALPELELKRKFAHDPQSTEIFEGKKAVFAALTDLIKDAKKGEEYLSFTVRGEHEDPAVSRFYQNITARRLDKGIKTKILSDIRFRSIHEKIYSPVLIKSINVRYTDFRFPQGIAIFRNKVLFLEWGERPTAIIITSRRMSDQFREYFNDIYEKAKE